MRSGTRHDLADALRAVGHEVGVVTLGVPGPDVVASVRPRAYALQDWADQPPWRRIAFHAADIYRPATATRSDVRSTIGGRT